jgi:hypothetical protein
LPFSLSEYKKGQLYMVAKASREESDGLNGVELIKDEPFENELGKGIFTHKIIHLESKLPEWTRRLIPESALQVEEKSWNAYPYSKTVYKVSSLPTDFLIPRSDPDLHEGTTLWRSL